MHTMISKEKYYMYFFLFVKLLWELLDVPHTYPSVPYVNDKLYLQVCYL